MHARAQINLIVAPWCGYSKYQMQQLDDEGLDAELHRRGIRLNRISCAAQGNSPELAPYCTGAPRFPTWHNASVNDAHVGAISDVDDIVALAQRAPAGAPFTREKPRATTPLRAQKHVSATTVATELLRRQAKETP